MWHLLRLSITWCGDNGFKKERTRNGQLRLTRDPRYKNPCPPEVWRQLWKTARRAISNLQHFIIYVLKFHKKWSHPDAALLIFYTPNSLSTQFFRLSWSFFRFCGSFWSACWHMAVSKMASSLVLISDFLPFLFPPLPPSSSSHCITHQVHSLFGSYSHLTNQAPSSDGFFSGFLVDNVLQATLYDANTLTSKSFKKIVAENTLNELFIVSTRNMPLTDYTSFHNSPISFQIKIVFKRFYLRRERERESTGTQAGGAAGVEGDRKSVV